MKSLDTSRRFFCGRNHIALLGSAFDPPTLAHMGLVALILHLGWVDEVWLLPYLSRPGKTPQASLEQRLKWLHVFQLIIERLGFYNKVKISLEDVYGEYRGTTKLVQRLQKYYPQNKFSLLMGEDSLRSIKNWDDPTSGIKNGIYLMQSIQIFVKPRPQGSIESARYPLDWGGNLDSTIKDLMLNEKALGIIPLPSFDLLKDQYADLFVLGEKLSHVSSSDVRKKAFEGTSLHVASGIDVSIYK